MYQIDSTQYQNTSIARFVQDLFASQNNGRSGTYSLTWRDHAANSFANSAFWRCSPSQCDWPKKIELYSGNDDHGRPIYPWGSALAGE